MDLNCPHCHKVIHLKQKYPYHAGFSNQGFIYCDSCPNIFEFHSYNQSYISVLGKHIHPWSLSSSEKKKVEDNLKPCPCGGYFRFNAYPRCPHCNNNIQSLLPDKIHFIEFGKVIDADKDESVWLSIGENSDRRNKTLK